MADRPVYREIEHTADVGLELKAPDRVSAFERAAAAMFDMMCDLDRVGDDWTEDVSVEGRPDDLEHLLIRWLTELLYLFDSRRVLLSSFEIDTLDDRAVRARVAGERFDPRRHALKVEIKAPTYHALRIERVGGEWFVRVIFDT